MIKYREIECPKCPQCGADIALQSESKLGISIEDRRLDYIFSPSS